MELIPRERKTSEFKLHSLDKTLGDTGLWAYPFYIESTRDPKTGVIKLKPHYQIFSAGASQREIAAFRLEIELRTGDCLGTLDDLLKSRPSLHQTGKILNP